MSEQLNRLSDLGVLKLEASKMASEQARNLALAGLAIVWLFAGPFFTGDADDAPADALYFAGVVLAASLGLDLLQLVLRALILDHLYNKAVDESDPEDDDPVVEDYGCLNAVTKTFFVAKVAALLAGYGGILVYFAQVVT